MDKTRIQHKNNKQINKKKFNPLTHTHCWSRCCCRCCCCFCCSNVIFFSLFGVSFPFISFQYTLQFISHLFLHFFLLLAAAYAYAYVKHILGIVSIYKFYTYSYWITLYVWVMSTSSNFFLFFLLFHFLEFNFFSFLFLLDIWIDFNLKHYSDAMR